MNALRRINNRKQAGFTLMEVIVSVSVFAFVIVSGIGVFLSTLQLDSKTRAERSVQQNARFILDYLSKEIRTGSVDYAAINDSANLSLVNQLGEKETITFSSEKLTLTKNGSTTDLNSANVKVTKFGFRLLPSVNPFVLSNNSNVQPSITIYMVLEAIDSRIENRATINVETTLTIRQYPSRS